ncbi:oxygenase MpaB family protein [Micromonospora haikouensis]|uniref:oxygenase MpaB family protein n=1 Tax=Micromonospora haikouensis TaxID=686309 RepID=UPI0033F8AA55
MGTATSFQPATRASHLRCHLSVQQTLGITEIPSSYEEFETWFDAHDATHLKPNDDAAAIERATRMLMLTRIPKPLAPLGNALVSAMYDAPLRHAMRVDTPAWPVRAGLHAALKTRSRLQRWFGAPQTTPLFADGITAKSYPDGYEISQLGPQQDQVPGRPTA